MSDPPGSGTVRVPFLVAAAAGPATALLHEFNVWSPGPSASLWPLFAIVLAAVLGILLGLSIGRREFRRLGWLAVVPNTLLLFFYGFLLLFFGLGGSR
jgi:hypothetical protein